MPKNAAKYSPEELKKVKARIKAAAKKYGIKIEQCEIPGIITFSHEIHFREEQDDGTVKFGGHAVHEGVHNHIRISKPNIKLSVENLKGVDIITDHAEMSKANSIAGKVIDTELSEDGEALVIDYIGKTNLTTAGKDLAILLKDPDVRLGDSIGSKDKIIGLEEDAEDGAWYKLKYDEMTFDHLMMTRINHQADKVGEGAIVTVTFSEDDSYIPFSEELITQEDSQEGTNLTEEEKKKEGNDLVPLLKEKDAEIVALKAKIEQLGKENAELKEDALKDKKQEAIDRVELAAKAVGKEMKREELEKLELEDLYELAVTLYEAKPPTTPAPELVTDDAGGDATAPSVDFSKPLWE
jgi:hypothetical protein